MKSSAEAVQLLDEIHQLMHLKGENPFKTRAFEKASHALAGRDDLLDRAKAGTLTEVPGVGKSIAEILSEFLLHGTSRVRDELEASLPPGLRELTSIPGLGPKKATQIIEELEIHSIRELEYACRENRLVKLKGFGEKAQQKILEGIQFLGAHQGQQRICDAIGAAEKLLKALVAAANSGRHPVAQALRVTEVGALRRWMETLSGLEYLVEVPPGEQAAGEIRQACEQAVEKFRRDWSGVLPVKLYFSVGSRFGFEAARLTATPEHWRAVGSPAAFDADDEEKFFAHMGLPWIAPEMRETGEEVALAKAGSLSKALKWDGVRGIFHNHTTRSDGSATLEEMVVAAKARGYHYIGISDHSQSAFYAQGLKVPDLLDQEREIRAVQDKYPEIRVFWGIESDILADGKLDYDESVLKRFDFVIASIHSRFKMDRAAMTERILTAIRNPCTRFLGHATGRLLLGRLGYDLDMEKVIEEAAKHDVAIEINANPARLDIDWRWGAKLRECGTCVSVNPDAHEVEGLDDTRYGIAMARKALLSTSQVVNARSAAEVERWLKRA